jgi:hypothetical protein
MKISYKKYKVENTTIDIKLIKYFNDIIYKKFNWEVKYVQENVHKLTNLVKKNIFAISLYSYIIQNILNDCAKYSQEICEYILKQVETIKDCVLLYSLPSETLSATSLKNNPRLKSFGITPYNASMKLDQLLELALGEKFTDLKIAADSQKICIIVLNNIIKTPLEFNVWNMINWNNAKNFIQDASMGVSQKIIDRFTTIKFKNPIKDDKWNFKTKYYGSIDSENFIIIENINNEDYRLMSLYNDMSVSGGGVLEKKIHKTRITELINFVKNDCSYKANTRISTYNSIHEKFITNNMFLESKIDIVKYNNLSKIIDSANLRFKIQNKIIKEFDNMVTDKFKSIQNIKSNKDFGQLIHHEKIIFIFNNILINEYSAYMKNNKDKMNNFPFSEIIQTFLMELNFINGKFKRKLHDLFILKKIDKAIYSENNIIKKKNLQQIFQDVLINTLSIIISDSSNIYQTLMYKNNLLMLSII